jgi:hypothetical protein
MTDVLSLRHQIIEMNKRVSEWLDKVNREFNHLWNINQIEPEKFQEKLQEIARIAERTVGDDPREDVFTLIELACWMYLQANDHERLEIRTMFAEHRSVLREIYSYIGRQASSLSADGNEEHLLRALLAASIEDQQVDTRNLHLCLIDLREAAHKHNINSDTYFHNIARLSSDTRSKNGYGVSTRAFLQSFLTPD